MRIIVNKGSMSSVVSKTYSGSTINPFWGLASALTIHMISLLLVSSRNLITFDISVDSPYKQGWPYIPNSTWITKEESKRCQNWKQSHILQRHNLQLKKRTYHKECLDQGRTSMCSQSRNLSGRSLTSLSSHGSSRWSIGTRTKQLMLQRKTKSTANDSSQHSARNRYPQ